VLLVTGTPWMALAIAAAAATTGERAPTDAARPARPATPRVAGLVPERIIGRSGTGPAEFRNPHGLIATPVGGLLVADTGNSRVQHLDPDGRLLWEAGGIGTEEGALRRPIAVSTATSLAYLVLDSLGRRVLEFHARGEYLGVGVDLASGAYRDRIGEVEPRGLAVDRSGNAILSDREGDRLLIFTPAWELLYEVGGFGDDAQGFDMPEGVATGPGRIFVADSMNGRIQVLDALGGFLTAWPLPGGGRPMAVATDRHGNLFVADAGGDRVLAFNAGGELVASLGATGDGPASFRRPSGLCVMGDRLVVADSGNDRLQVLRIGYATVE
jgi:DNA-binding beta-propeller fold protein YncE